MQRSGRLRLSEVNQHLVCVLCGGYFIDATTIVECLHSFCRSCLIKYLEGNSFCPICDVQIHKAKPFLNIKPDKALQDIVYKLVPGLFHSEMRRRREFYVRHPERASETTPEGRGVGVERLIYSPEDSISLSLEYLDGDQDDLGCTSSRSSVSDTSASEVAVSKRYLQCPALVTIAHLKKFLRLKYELSATHTVEVIHMRESLPDEYTLMDVAYIYTWKRNGPMRFFYRISQTQNEVVSAPVEKQLHTAEVVSVPVEKQLPTVTTSVSVEQPSVAPVTSQLPSTVPRLTPPPSSSVEQDSERLPPTTTTTTRPPELSSKTVAATVSSQTASDMVITISTQPCVATVTSSVTQPTPTIPTINTQALPTPVKILSVAPTTTPVNRIPSPFPQTTLPVVRAQYRTRIVTKATTPSSTTVTKTPLVSRPTNPLISTVPKTPIRPTMMPVIRSSMPSSATGNKTPTQEQTHSLSVTKTRQQPVPVAITRPSTNQLSAATYTGITTQKPASETLNKELIEVPLKTVTRSVTDSVQPPEQQSSVGESIPPKCDQVSSGEVSDDKSRPQASSLSVLADNTVCKVLPEQVQPSESCKEPAVINCKDKLSSEVSSKTLSDSGFTMSIPPDTANKTKPTLAKVVQQRSQMFARKSSLFNKVTPDATNTKGHLSGAKDMLPATREPTKLPRVNQKVTDKHSAANCFTFRKDKPDDNDKKKVVKEESPNMTSVPEKKLEKQTTSTNSTPLASNNNNNNKIPQQNLQTIKNNQQILKKNDEITRCANTIKRSTQILQRKSQDSLKTCSVQLRAIDDKLSSKKRRMHATNAVKRPLVNSVDVTKQDDVEPGVKKWRSGVENNHKIIHADQKSEVKVKCSLNSSESHTPQNATEKSDASEASQNVLKTSKSIFQTPALQETTERHTSAAKNHDVNKNNVTSDKAQSYTPMQTPLHTPQTSVMSKQFDSQSRTPAPKPELSGPKSDVKPPGPSSCVRNVQTPSVPVPAAAHSNQNPRIQSAPLKAKPDGECALDLSASPRRQHQSAISSITQTLARRHQQQYPSPAPPPLSPLSSLSPFPVMSIPVRSPPPQLRIPVLPHHRSGHSQQQRPSSLSSSSPSPPADMLPGCSRTGLQHQQQQHQQQQQPLDIYPSHLLPPTAVMYLQQLEMQRLWNSGKPGSNPRMGLNDANSIKRFEEYIKTLQQQQQQQQQQQGTRNASFHPFNNTTATPNNHRK